MVTDKYITNYILENREIREYSHHALINTNGGGIRTQEHSSGRTIPLPL